MIAAGRLVGVVKNILSGGYDVTFHCDELPDTDGIIDKTLTIEAKVKRNRRSIDANNYAWLLMGRIADETNRTKEEVYTDALRDYGQHAFLMRVEHNAVVDAVGLYYSFLEYDGQYDIYEVFRGSSTYDTKEMSVFIDGIVSDAKTLGIDTVPVAELDKIKRKWRI